MPYIFVRCHISHLDGQDAFDADKWRSRKITFIDFQLGEDGNDETLSELIGMNLSGDRRDNNRWEHGNKKPHYQTYACYHPPHVVFNELEIHAGYKVIAANTTTDTFVWTLHKP